MQPSQARRWPRYLILAATVLVLATVLMAAWTASRNAGPTPPAATPGLRTAIQPGAAHPHTPPPATPPPAPAPAPAPAAAVAQPGTPQLPMVNLSGLKWADFHGVELPQSPAAGPRLTGASLASGFTDTPLGALLAAVNIAVRANAQWGPAVFVPTIDRQVTGPDTAALLAACRTSYQQGLAAAGVTPGQPLGRAYVTELAFRWDGYTPADATVDIVSAGPGGQDSTVWAATRIQVQWRGGDWRVVAPPGGDWGASATQVTSLASYTSFPVPA